jgi:hypothetical protein
MKTQNEIKELQYLIIEFEKIKKLVEMQVYEMPEKHHQTIINILMGKTVKHIKTRSENNTVNISGQGIFESIVYDSDNYTIETKNKRYSFAYYRAYEISCKMLLLLSSQIKSLTKNQKTMKTKNTITEKISKEQILQLVDYSEKAFAVIGDTKSHKDILKELGGKYNPYLSCGKGWIFSKKAQEKVEQFVNSI